MRERKGPVYDLAMQRATLEAAFGTVGAMMGVNLKTYPAGEQALRREQQEINGLARSEATRLGWNVNGPDDAWDYLKAKAAMGKGSAIATWFDTHPEYSARTEVYKTPEERVARATGDVTWEALTDLPSSYRTGLSARESAALDKWYAVRDVSKLTPTERQQLALIVADIQERKLTPGFQHLQDLQRERRDLLTAEVKRLGGDPEAIDDQYAWLKERGATKKGSALATWYDQHPEYFGEPAKGGTTSTPSTWTGATAKTTGYNPWPAITGTGIGTAHVTLPGRSSSGGGGGGSWGSSGGGYGYGRVTDWRDVAYAMPAAAAQELQGFFLGQGTMGAETHAALESLWRQMRIGGSVEEFVEYLRRLWERRRAYAYQPKMVYQRPRQWGR